MEPVTPEPGKENVDFGGSRIPRLVRVIGFRVLTVFMADLTH